MCRRQSNVELRNKKQRVPIKQCGVVDFIKYLGLSKANYDTACFGLILNLYVWIWRAQIRSKSLCYRQLGEIGLYDSPLLAAQPGFQATSPMWMACDSLKTYVRCSLDFWKKKFNVFLSNWRQVHIQVQVHIQTISVTVSAPKWLICTMVFSVNRKSTFKNMVGVLFGIILI